MTHSALTPDKRWVFEGTEVRRTGRIAVKVVKTGTAGRERKLTLIEVTPVADFDWKKWVTPDSLYEVIDEAEP